MRIAMVTRAFLRSLQVILVLGALSAVALGQAPGHVSFYRDVKPILQKRCQGCHQPVTQGGKLVLTTFEAFRAGGSAGPSFVPGKPDESIIMKFIVGNPPNMPKNQKPLEQAQIETIRHWIAEGAKNDTPTIKDPIDAD